VAHRAALISVSIALSQTPAEATSPWTRGQCVAWSACLAHSLRRYQFILLGEHRHRWVAREVERLELEPATSCTYLFGFLVFIIGVVGLCCQYHSRVMAGKSRPRNQLLCVECMGR